MYPGGIAPDERLVIVETYSAGLVLIVRLVVLTVPRLVFVPDGATEYSVVASVVTDRMVEAEIHK